MGSLFSSESSSYSFVPVTGQSDGYDFRIGSYNILADIYAPQNVFKMEDRAPVIAKEVASCGFDVICLQEVELSSFNLLKTLLSEFEGIFCPNEEGDGCAILYKRSSFELKEQENFAFPKLALSYEKSDDAVGIVCKQKLKHILHHSVFQIVLLCHRKTGKQVCVANTHLYWGPGVPAQHYQMQIVQMKLLFDQTEKLREKWGKNHSFMLCGDFNCEKGALIDYVKSGTLPKSDGTLTMEGATQEAKEELKHSFQTLSSVYPSPRAVTIVSDFRGAIDWIFISSEVQVCETLEAQSVPAGGEFFPNSVHPSDHFLIGCSLSFK